MQLDAKPDPWSDLKVLGSPKIGYQWEWNAVAVVRAEVSVTGINIVMRECMQIIESIAGYPVLSLSSLLRMWWSI